MKAWLVQHWQAFIFTLKRFVLTPFGSAFSILVIGITFSLPVGIYMLVDNVQSLSKQTADTPQFSIFLRLDAGKVEMEKVKQRLEQHPQVENFKFVSKQQALQQLKQGDQLTGVIENLAHNPLPDAFIVTARGTVAKEIEQLYNTLQEWAEIEYVQFDSAWNKRLDALLNFGRLVIIMLATLLSIALMVIIFNTIRLQILTKRDEIELSKLIGATDRFIRRPFLYFGAIQGFMGGVAALLIVAFSIELINDELMLLSELYSVNFQLQNPSVEDSISLLLFSAWLGWLGARLSVASYLWQIEPK